MKLNVDVDKLDDIISLCVKCDSSLSYVEQRTMDDEVYEVYLCPTCNREHSYRYEVTRNLRIVKIID